MMNDNNDGTNSFKDLPLDKTDLSEFFSDSALLEMLDEQPIHHISLDDLKFLRTDNQYEGFDSNSGEEWIYPINYPIRQYQFNIIKKALYTNTLVVLPTGLGKTFIAAVIIYNIYRWYPRGKIIFMAPTRPLVHQQINACYEIMGIPKNDTVELTGKTPPNTRLKLWKEKRLFFCTPEVVQSDVKSDNFPVNDVRLLVFDEAHKAKGKYAYSEVIKAIYKLNKIFRVIALSATPGKNFEEVKAVVHNLLISHIEVRSDNSIDVISYTHKKKIKTVVVPLGIRLTKIKDEFIAIIDPYVKNLLDNDVISGSTGNLTKGRILYEQSRFRQMSITHSHINHKQIVADFSTCVSLYHALSLLDSYGVRIFLNFFEVSNSSEKYFVSQNPTLKMFLNNLREDVGTNLFDENLSEDMPLDNINFGHPKFEILQNYIIEHFSNDKDSRVIIFCEYRDCVILLNRFLKQNRPCVRSEIIVGQGKSSGITQKQQIAVMNNFKSGKINTLIATCVAEEGLDIGSVDLIICFDISSKNPIRFIQRIGRTGRQRQGQVVMLVTEGHEQRLIKDVLINKDKINEKIINNKEISRELYSNSPRLVPPNISPKCLETFIKVDGVKSVSPTKLLDKIIEAKNESFSPESNKFIINKAIKKGTKKAKTNNSVQVVLKDFFKNKKADTNVITLLEDDEDLNLIKNSVNNESETNIKNLLLQSIQFFQNELNLEEQTRKDKILHEFGIKDVKLNNNYLSNLKISLEKLKNEHKFFKEINLTQNETIPNLDDSFNERSLLEGQEIEIVIEKEIENKSSTVQENEILNYLLLESLDDWFKNLDEFVSQKKIENEIFIENKIIENNNMFNDVESKNTTLVNEINKMKDKEEIEINEIYSETQVMNFFVDEEETRYKSLMEKLNIESNNRKKLDNTINLDIFLNSDDDLFADSICVNKTKEQNILNDDTQEYSFDKQKFQTIYREKSSDLFESFNMLPSESKNVTQSTSPVQQKFVLSNEKSPSILFNRKQISITEDINKFTSTPKDSQFISNSKLESKLEDDESLIVRKRCKRILTIESESETEDELFINNKCISSKIRKISRNTKAKTPRYCEFLDEEANVVGIVSDDEELDQTGTNSIIISDDDVGDENVDMQAKYLQSIRSQINKPGMFKIPQPTKFKDISNIYSQPPCNDSFNNYIEDSFVVSESQINNKSESSDECPLERAEAILLSRKRNRRNISNKILELSNIRKRTKIVTYDSSDEDDFFQKKHKTK